MPFYYRAVESGQGGGATREAPFQNAIQDDADPDQENGVDRDGSYRLSWTLPEPPAEQPCGFQVEEATTFSSVFADGGEEPLIAGSNTKWTGTVEWISSAHPNTGTTGYSVVYIDSINATLTNARYPNERFGQCAQMFRTSRARRRSSAATVGPRGAPGGNERSARVRLLRGYRG